MKIQNLNATVEGLAIEALGMLVEAALYKVNKIGSIEYVLMEPEDQRNPFKVFPGVTSVEYIGLASGAARPVGRQPQELDLRWVQPRVAAFELGVSEKTIYNRANKGVYQRKLEGNKTYVQVPLNLP